MLGNREKASKYKEQIQDKPEDVAATLIMVSHLLTQVRNTQPGESSVSNWELVDSLHKDLARARKVAPTDARLVVAEVNLQLIKPEVNRPLVVTALAGLFGAPTDTANQALAVAQLQCGVSWQVQKAEETLRAYAKSLGEKNPEGTFALARWLIQRGRVTEAEQMLTALNGAITPP